MREIKFRMWGFSKNGYFPLDQSMACLAQQVSGLYDHLQHGDCFEQYTGLHDGTKWADLTEDDRAAWTRSGHMPSDWQGLEIYEGDIVKEFSIDFGEEIGYVEYQAPCFVVHYKNNISMEVCQRHTKVIGNVHENADLLK